MCSFVTFVLSKIVTFLLSVTENKIELNKLQWYQCQQIDIILFACYSSNARCIINRW